MHIIVGLGNPGIKFKGTRHNIGFEVLDYMAEKYGVKLNKIKFKSLYNIVEINGKKVMLLKPQTYMNKSGEAVLEAREFYKVPTSNIIVVQDDIDIDLGRLKIKKKGSAGTHNGLKSIIQLLKDDQFPRLKLGIGKAENGEDLAVFVLGKFKPDEKPIIEELVLRAVESLESIVKENIDAAMNKYNR